MYYCHICYRYINEICGDYGNACEVIEIGDEIMRLFMFLLSVLWFTTKFYNMFLGTSFLSYFLPSHTPPKFRATFSHVLALKERLQNKPVHGYVHIP